MAGLLAVVSSAHAEEPLHWVTGPEETELEGAESLDVQAAGTSVFKTSLGGKYESEFLATNVEALGVSIENWASGAIGSGRFRFTGMSFQGQPGCTIPESVTTSPLTFTVERVGSHAYLKIVPVSGETTGLLEFKITNCAIATRVVLKGRMRGEFADPPGTMVAEQEVQFSPSSTTYAALHLGKYPVDFTSAMRFHMTGGLSGSAFGLL